ncbi:membrane protein [Marinomonas ushuaiensis DSM 15871]|uniref:Membrane protein n=1 Tax=Marinomonas ushuaiensis DSM 15871 TaxID=1122207 RepID=X7E8X7_9GAMM|nr:PACE efflux transporter [Marinomonas ushuaiensis]ETX12377.1 membrane protein [Marinomonas ushuaiensis DSM 15871]
MKTVERIFQAVLFEVTVLSIIIPSSVIIGGFDTGKMTIVAVAISLFAMLWNYIYNLIFDKLMGFNRLERGLVLRVSHAVGFELGMAAITLPVMAWYLGITLLAAAILEAAFLIFILVYTLVFNWAYDRYQPYQVWFSKH